MEKERNFVCVCAPQNPIVSIARIGSNRKTRLRISWNTEIENATKNCTNPPAYVFLSPTKRKEKRNKDPPFFHNINKGEMN